MEKKYKIIGIDVGAKVWGWAIVDILQSTGYHTQSYECGYCNTSNHESYYEDVYGLLVSEQPSVVIVATPNIGGRRGNFKTAAQQMEYIGILALVCTKLDIQLEYITDLTARALVFADSGIKGAKTKDKIAPILEFKYGVTQMDAGDALVNALYKAKKIKNEYLSNQN